MSRITHPSKKTYYTIFTILIAMTLFTIQAAFIDLGPLNTPIALGIASFKAILVILYFMHVRYNPKLLWLFIGGAVAWLVLMILVTMSDYMSRGWLPFPGK